MKKGWTNIIVLLILHVPHGNSTCNGKADNHKGMEEGMWKVATKPISIMQSPDLPGMD